MRESLTDLVRRKPVVLFVHAVDTEGPISESLNDTFERLYDLFGVVLPATRSNLEALQKQAIPLGGLEKEVANCFSEKRLAYIENLSDLDKMLDVLFSDELRTSHPDSLGNPYVFSWFCLDHVGFESNPRRRILGYNEIVRHYLSRLNQNKAFCKYPDSIEWHYHAVPFSRKANQFGLNWSYDNCHLQVLSRRLLDFSIFPSCYRAGGWIERPDINLFLEQWVPFDYSNHRLSFTNTAQPDYISKRFSDWSRARADWCAYHPSLRDYQAEGDLRRAIFRSLSIDARAGGITGDDIELAFEQARSGKCPVLSVTNHDNRDMRVEIEYVWRLLSAIRKKYSDVQLVYVGARDAAMLHLHAKLSTQWAIGVDIRGNCLIIKSDRELFGPQPFLAFQTKTGQYYHDNFSRVNEREWFYEFDSYTIPMHGVAKIGVAAHDIYGSLTIVNMNLD
jgi:hypothetical protein